jgi:hypothetical protein
MKMLLQHKDRKNYHTKNRKDGYGGVLRILDISGPGHLGTDLDISVLGPGHFGTDLDISVLGTGQFGTWMRQYSLLTTIVWYLLIVNIFVQIVL